jgi:hypothetical protein
MNINYAKNFLLIAMLSLINSLSGQTAVNDECNQAIGLGLIKSYCSGTTVLTNLNSTVSQNPVTICNQMNDNDGDVWYTFRIDRLAVNVRLSGRGEGQSNTLEKPTVSLYRGRCNNLELLGCNTTQRVNFSELVISKIVPGETLYLRISGKQGSKGRFQLCIDGINVDRIAESDCSKAQILCDKDPFRVPLLAGFGDVPDEADNSCLDLYNRFIGATASESASAWYKWKVKTAGTLSFTLTPFGADQDLDFAVYRLPRGENDCSVKELVRCMASGNTQGQTASQNAPCNGPTGLSLSSNDQVEDAGCDRGDDNFVAALDMKVGEVYALVINNYSNDGKGFSIQFGGTGTFEGPDFNFGVEDVSVLECDKKVQFKSTITAGIDSIVDYTWIFGNDSSTPAATGAGPHNVEYTRFGDKAAALTVKSLKGCITTKVIEFFVKPCCRDTGVIRVNPFVQKELDCIGDSNAVIGVNAQGGGGEYVFSLDNQRFFDGSFFNSLAEGRYKVFVRDQKGCVGEADVTVQRPPDLKVNAGQDVSVILGESTRISGQLDPPDLRFFWQVISMGCDQVQFDTLALDQVFTPLGATTLILNGINKNGCTTNDSLRINVATEYLLEAANIIKTNPTLPQNRFLSFSGDINFKRIVDLSIYDRWGNKIWYNTEIKANDPLSGWDGTAHGRPVMPGVYVWVANLEYLDCNVITQKGSITVVD